MSAIIGGPSDTLRNGTPKPRTKSAAETQWDESAVNTPPPGVPIAFWQKVLNDPANAAGIKYLTDPTARGGIDRFSSKEQYLKFLQEGGTRQYNSLPDAQKKLYTDADTNGNPFDPQSPEGLNWQKRQLEEGVNAETDSMFDQWEGNPQELMDAATAAAGGNQAAIDKLNDLLNGIKDPELAKYVGDYVSQAASAGADPRDIEAQQRQLTKLEGLSDPSITAEEKLMMEMSRRQTESDLRAQRGALKNDLLARGVYGSGAELTMNAAAQQEAASRQALEMLGAQANAQKRAMESLKGAADLSTSMRGSSAAESQFRGTAADRAAEFNKNLKRQYDEYVTKTKAEQNRDAVTRGETGFSATTGLNDKSFNNLLQAKQLGLQGTVAHAADKRGGIAQIGGTVGTDINKASADETKEEMDAL